MVRGQVLDHQVRRAEDGGEQVVEVVRHPGREATYRFHLLRLAELLLEPPPLGDVVDDHELGAPPGE